MRLCMALFLAIYALPATADELIEKFKLNIANCWVAPISDANVKMKATLEVHFSTSGEVKNIEVIKAPAGPEGKAFVHSTIRAVQRCAPYDKLPDEKITINFESPTA